VGTRGELLEELRDGLEKARDIVDDIVEDGN
jgi:hypothetical protein